MDLFLRLNPKPKKLFYEGANIHFESSKLSIFKNFEEESFIKLFPTDHFVFVRDSDSTDLKIETFISPSEKDLKEFIKSNDIELSIDIMDVESYLMKVEKENRTVKIFSKSKKGIFYGLQTLRQLVDFENKLLPIVEILDSPSFKMRGIIEGFYGEPWSHQNRLDMINFCGRNKMNTYWYAPKDDPYHREKWREDYPEEEIEKIDELIKVSKDNFVDFVFCVSPGLSMKFGDQKEFDLLCKKYYEILSKGVKKFAILFDDIREKLNYEEDERRFEGNYGLAQTYVANKLYEFLKRKDSETNLYFCPTEYWQEEDSLYRRTMKENLNPEIPVIWTGKGVWSKRVSRKNADKISKQFGHDLILWDNYPVNDADQGELFLAPLMNRENDLCISKVKGVISNPMNQPYASMLALQTIADYLWNSQAYDPLCSWNKSIFNLIGSDFFEDMKLFSENFLKSRIFGETSFKLKSLIREFRNDSLNKKKELKEYLERLSNLEGKLRYIKDKKLYEDIHPWLKKLSQLAGVASNLLSSNEKVDIKNEVDRLDSYVVCDGILERFIEDFERK
ncbi:MULTISPECIES: beta-N-acetylglucosaminidase domain-containing protein [Petrotoga]|uniref:Hyaluronoglucosaminidase n=1 Tax=Petrotoga sibirica TaxID=156202 RepID=A0A4R8EM06_9BACT|nr:MULTISPECIES: beta-N-acetylglucosaminidase domain-containing protein [Petrotoga]TDX13190.1 hyaluronoglucosaminidase [Petrotoga sibirica]